MDQIVDDGGDMTLLLHEGKKYEDAFAKVPTLGNVPRSGARHDMSPDMKTHSPRCQVLHVITIAVAMGI